MFHFVCSVTVVLASMPKVTQDIDLNLSSNHVSGVKYKPEYNQLLVRY